MDNRKFGALSSSVNPNELANTVKATIVGLSSTIILLAGLLFDLPIAAEDVTEFASQAGYGIASVWFFYGLIQKFVVKYARK